LTLVLLALSVLSMLAACDQNRSQQNFTGVASESSPARTPGPDEIAARLIRQTIADSDGRHVAVEIDAELLRDLTARPKDDASIAQFRDPLQAARLFAAHIGQPANATFSIVQKSLQAEEASGFFIAMVKVSSAGHSINMRMISAPAADGQPSVWVLNDYEQ
jgi:hypothetical protein